MTHRRIVLLVAVFTAAVVAFATRPPATGITSNPALARAADVLAGADNAGSGVIAAVTPTQRDGSSPQRSVAELAFLGAAIGALGALWSTVRHHAPRARRRAARGRVASRAPPALLDQLTLS
jgi:hypothetical protein